MSVRPTQTLVTLALPNEHTSFSISAGEGLERKTTRDTRATRLLEKDILERRTTVVDRLKIRVRSTADKIVTAIAKVSAALLASCGLWAAGQLATSAFHLKATAALISIWGSTALVPVAIIALLAVRSLTAAPHETENKAASTDVADQNPLHQGRAFTTLTFAGAETDSPQLAGLKGPSQRTQTVRLPMTAREHPPSLKAELFFRDAPLRIPERPWEQLQEPVGRSSTPRTEVTVVNRPPFPVSTTELRLDNPWATRARKSDPYNS